LGATKEGSDLGDIGWDAQVSNGAQIRVLGLHPMFGDGVVVEGYFPNSKFDFGGFDLYAGLEATT
jgi:hypothetical protein